MKIAKGLGLALALGAGLAVEARADLSRYYIGRDTREGTNQGHVTLLFNHVDHFHRLGVYGGAEGRIPEGYIGGELWLWEGEGAFAGRYVSASYHIEGDPTSTYSDLEIRPISTLVADENGNPYPGDSPEGILLAGGTRYLGDLSGTSLALELVSISGGLSVGDGLGNVLMSSPGDQFLLGPGDGFAPFTPVFWTEVGAAPYSTYSATFRLVDVNGIVPESGTFRYEFQTVPEPSGLALIGLGVATSLAILRRSAVRSVDPA